MIGFDVLFSYQGLGFFASLILGLLPLSLLDLVVEDWTPSCPLEVMFALGVCSVLFREEAFQRLCFWVAACHGSGGVFQAGCLGFSPSVVVVPLSVLVAYVRSQITSGDGSDYGDFVRNLSTRSLMR
jgi:hypothetical protein